MRLAAALALSLAAGCAAPPPAPPGAAALAATLVSGDPAAEFLGSGAVFDGDRILASAYATVHLFEAEGDGWREAAVFEQEAEFTFFGQGLALDGDRAAIGVPGQAAVLLIERQRDAWVEADRLVGEASSDFGWSVALDGDRLLVGAPARGGGAGRAFVYEKAGDGWEQRARLDDGEPEFGLAVALDGDRAVVSSAPETSGAVSVFERGDAGWARTQTLREDSSLDWFGRTLSLDGDRLLVGAPDPAQGAAFVYAYAGGAWTEEARLAAPRRDGGRFGWAGALDGHRAIVTSVEGSGDRSASYAAVYVREGGGWTPSAVLTVPGGQRNARFGQSAGLAGGRALVGANQAAGGLGGALYLFDLGAD